MKLIYLFGLFIGATPAAAFTDNRCIILCVVPALVFSIRLVANKHNAYQPVDDHLNMGRA